MAMESMSLCVHGSDADAQPRRRLIAKLRVSSGNAVAEKKKTTKAKKKFHEEVSESKKEEIAVTKKRERDQEIEDLFKKKKRKTIDEKTAHEVAMHVEELLATLEVAAEEDAELNKRSQPAVNKLIKLPLLHRLLCMRGKLQEELLEHGVLSVVKNWLEPLPDGSLPNVTIRSAILQLLNDYPLDLSNYDRREQLKRSGLGKVVMFLSKSVDEEISPNRRLATHLVNKWCQPIFNNNNNNNNDDAALVLYKPTQTMIKSSSSRPLLMIESKEEDMDLLFSQLPLQKRQPLSKQPVARPDPLSMDFVIRPPSKVNPSHIRSAAQSKQAGKDQCIRSRVEKKLRSLKASSKKHLKATTLSAGHMMLMSCC